MIVRSSPRATVASLVRQAWAIANNPSHLDWIGPLLWLADSVLCIAVMRFIPYTEIDWKAYMQQIAIYRTGERDYKKIVGDTGPLVYPGGHVHIFNALYAITSGGENILLAQMIFAGLYLATLALVMLCYREAKAPPILLPLLCASKRLHSIFMLRMFNDGVAVFFLFLTVYLYQKRQWTYGSIAYTCGLGVKMSLLLALPAIGIVLWQARGRGAALKQAWIIGELQIIFGHEFTLNHASSYLTRAFELSKGFLFKWTVNWRFVGEDMFLSREFSLTLLAAHVALLVDFAAEVWLRPSQLSLLQVPQALLKPPGKEWRDRTAKRVTPAYILHAILSAVNIGCLCARSLHYQFYTYIVWATPFLLWRAGLHPVMVYILFAAQEWGWNVYPSTNISSMVVVAVMAVGACTVIAARLALWRAEQNVDEVTTE